MIPTNNGKSDYINLDETPGIFQMNRCSKWLTFPILVVLIFLYNRSGSHCVRDMFCRCWKFIRRNFESAVNSCLGNVFSGRISATALYYCQSDLAGNEFENLCGQFLQDISLRKVKVDELAVGRIFLVLELPPKNRQNNVDVLSDDIKCITRNHLLEGNDDIIMILIQISFDGNNIENPPNLMTDDTFEGIKIRLKRNFASYINIVYTGKHHFQDCDINRNAAEKLLSLSKKEK